jgi:hypothetical protein
MCSPTRKGKHCNRSSNYGQEEGFVTFDFDNDKTLKEFLIGQAKLADSPFEISDYSLKEEAPETEWLTRATAAIKRAEVFIVVLGPKTRSARGVLKEVGIAKGIEQGAISTHRRQERGRVLGRPRRWNHVWLEIGRV